jgi:hypothetical protein
VTQSELILVIKTLLACKSYGAESRTGGDCRNSIVGIVGGWEEIITPLELTLELYDSKDQFSADRLAEKLRAKYKPLAGNPDQVTILEPAEVDAVVAQCSAQLLDKGFLDKAYKDIEDYRAAQRP